MSTAKFNQWLNSDGTENYKCRAWVNFNGTGTVAIRAAGNVSSITDNGVGDYTVNFTNAMPDANYSSTATVGGATLANALANNSGAAQTTTTVRVATRVANTNVAADYDTVFVSAFR